MITGWQGEALNTAPDSANQIHGDDIAKQFGFKGGLVPGVTISAYLLQPAVVAWGQDFLNRGQAHVRVGQPLYDGEIFRVEIDEQETSGYNARILRPDDIVSANAEVSLSENPPPPPVRRGDRLAEKGYIGPKATMQHWAALKSDGCLAKRYRWGGEEEHRTYLRDSSLMPGLLSGDDAFANMGFILGTSNWILAMNAYMNPWVHLETTSQNYRSIAMGTAIITEMEVIDFYEKKGHEFVDARIALYDEADDACLSTIELRAIYKLRGL